MEITLIEGEIKDVRKAIETLKVHQQWRLGKIDEMPFKPLEITNALDILLHVVDQKYRCNYCETDVTIPIILCKDCTE
jgi:hypothetical protein